MTVFVQLLQSKQHVRERSTVGGCGFCSCFVQCRQPAGCRRAEGVIRAVAFVGARANMGVKDSAFWSRVGRVYLGSGDATSSLEEGPSVAVRSFCSGCCTIDLMAARV